MVYYYKILIINIIRIINFSVDAYAKPREAGDGFNRQFDILKLTTLDLKSVVHFCRNYE